MTTTRRFDEEFRDKAMTRAENDVTLLPRIASIRNGSADEPLGRFAKAYLGLFLEMDNSIAPADRITILANPALAEAVHAGFHAALLRQDLPNAAAIAESLVHEQPLEIGYVILAGINELAQAQPDAVVQLPEHTQAAAVCFHYANKTEIPDRWLLEVMAHHPKMMATTLQEFWLTLIAHEIDYLPGLEPVLTKSELQAIAASVILPVLRDWRQCRKKILREVLITALQLADQSAVQAIVEQALSQWNPNEPARYAQWLAAAYLLSPLDHAVPLAEYMGRSRERILPLLDFVAMALQRDKVQRYELSATAYANLIKVIAARFSPQVDRFGNLCDNSLKLLYLFYRLATSRDPQTVEVIDKLHKVRVMKLYDAILEQVQQLHQQGQPFPTAEEFIAGLQAAGHIKSKRNWSDLK